MSFSLEQQSSIKVENISDIRDAVNMFWVKRKEALDNVRYKDLLHQLSGSIFSDSETSYQER